MNHQQISKMTYFQFLGAFWQAWFQSFKKGVETVTLSFKTGGIRGKVGAIIWWATMPLGLWVFIPTGHSFWLKTGICYLASLVSWGLNHNTFYKYSEEYRLGIAFFTNWWTGVTKSVKS